ncbi:MAG: type III-A CRISPR-associated protein Cas10/Csm1 [Oscillospiraceae bacterium]|nr:type III-A CRISPR-associated protein Cas10/Csm1 [Oscillospiraceae bacterium]
MRNETASLTRACLMHSAGLPASMSSAERETVELAQWLAAGGQEPAKPPRQLLKPIFTHLNGEHGGFVLEPKPLDNIVQMPVPEAKMCYRPQAVQACLDAVQAGCTALPPGSDGIAPLLGLLEQQLTNLPAPLEGSGDISLYDYCKLTTAIGSCIAEWGKPVTREQLPEMHCFLLYSADFSGIQRFIYTVHTQHALRALRSRSFVLELLMEHYIDELLGACGVSRANLLYSGGGHCYLLLPNTDAVKATLTGWNLRFNDWLAEQFGVRLFLAHGWTVCTGNELLNTPAAEAHQKAMFRRVSSQVSAHKLHRFSAAQLRRLNSGQADGTDRECKVCGQAKVVRWDKTSGDGRCGWCDLFETISGGLIQEEQFFFWVGDLSQGARAFSLPTVEGKTDVMLTNRAQVDTCLQTGRQPRRLYSVNQYCPSLPNCTILHMGNYASETEMERLAEASEGIPRLGVCRMNVDNLGQSFVAGFERSLPDPTEKSRYVSLVRTAAFSRRMSLFFKGYINSILREQPALKVTVVYSGGDDVFLVGAWNDAIEAASRIRSALRTYTCGALTISGGVGVFQEKFPIRVAAAQTARLEEQAKSLPAVPELKQPEKDGLALFGAETDHCYHWDVFHQSVQGEKLELLESFFGSGDAERGNSMLYNILGLLREAQADDSRMPLARYAYLLSRLAPPNSAPEEAKKTYKDFSKKMYHWGLEEEPRRQLLTAIQLYVYLHRKQEQQKGEITDDTEP